MVKLPDFKAKFVVKNVSTKKVRVFGYNMEPGSSRDLFTLTPPPSETEVLNSLAYGDLGREIHEKKNLEVVSNDMPLSRGYFDRRVSFNYNWFDENATVELYVSYSRGRDGGDGSEENPFNSIQAAFDAVPEGYLSSINIYLDEEEVSAGISARLNARPGAGLFPHVKVVGVLKVIEEITPISPPISWVSPNGVTRELKQIACNPWATTIVEGKHLIFQKYNSSGYVLSASCFPRSVSDKNNGILVSTGSLYDENHQGYAEPAQLCEWGTRFNFLRLVCDSNRILVENVSTESLLTVNADIIRCRAGSSAEITFSANTTGKRRIVTEGGTVVYNADNDPRFYWNYFGGLTKFVCTSIDGLWGGHSEFKGRVYVIGNVESMSLLFLSGGAALHIGSVYSTSQTTGSIRKNGAAHVSDLRTVDAEGTGSNKLVLTSGSHVELRGNIVFDGVTNPLLIENRSTLVRASGTISGKCTGNIIVRKGGSANGATQWSVETSQDGGTLVKVGGNAAISVADLISAGGDSDPKHGSWVQP